MRQVFPRSKWKRRILITLGVVLLLYLFRVPILQGMGAYLNDSDPVERTEAVFVLGGSPMDRSLKAVELYRNDLVENEIICTGGNIAGALSAFNIHVPEAGLSRKVLEDEGVPSEIIIELTSSTSTFEEADEALQYIKTKGWKKVGIISSEYHIRRVRGTFEDHFEDEENIELLFFSADSPRFNQDSWWQDEESFLLCFSEYLKLFYYFLKY